MTGPGLVRALVATAVLLLGVASCSAAPAKRGDDATSAPAPLATTPQPAPPDSATVIALLAGVTNATCPLPGVASGGQVARRHVQGLARAGFRTVLDMRGPDEPRGYDEARAVREAGLEYALIPVTGDLGDPTFDRVRAFMNDAKRHPVMVHCASGNRVGVALLPWLVLDRGWKLSEAVAIAEQGGMRQSPMRDLALDYIERKRATR